MIRNAEEVADGNEKTFQQEAAELLGTRPKIQETSPEISIFIRKDGHVRRGGLC
ncbi:MAG: hypothetical protein NC092_00240 [Butyrivibrio sp.]|nr:hypothetical protein [Muribaculum sp.]MCM1551102.1 hypothetical protein [Butyrivibrio sp.]